ncbi:MAG TPA: preprotein translocase subunit SecY [Candidatus Paceibacterota bacterium]|nr:preprotein translocase subunit SecY [Candidatus Paceibacterota bacterium]
MSKLTHFLKDKELRHHLLVIAAILLLVRLMYVIPVPGVDQAKWQTILENNKIFGLASMLSGGALAKLSIAMLGIGPYITASIIMQLLAMVFPSLKEMEQEGTASDRKRFEQYSRILAIPLAILQGFSYLNILKAQGVINYTPVTLLLNLLVITVVSIFMMWLGENITSQKLGNGISILIFSGIVAEYPQEISLTIANYSANPSTALMLNIIITFLMAFLVILGVIYVTEAERKIPVSYAKRVRGTKVYGGASTYLPMKVNQTGMIPIIFASSILMFPSLIGSLLSTVKNNATVLKVSHFLTTVLNPSATNWSYVIAYFVMVVLFTYFYTAITFEPKTISDNLQKNGGFIPGYRPGKITEDFLNKTSTRITLFGAIFLGLMAVLPFIVQRFTKITTLTIGGAGILIVVGVAVEIIKAFEAQISLREYDSI